MAAAGKSRFAVSCGLLRQYMREHEHQQTQRQTDSLASSFLLPPPREAIMDDAEKTDARTMQLFPTHAGTSRQPSQKRWEKQARTPLTIFYEGRVLLFEDFPADNAKQLMQLAGSGSAPTLMMNEVQVVPQKPAATEPLSLPSDVPIARKASLKRFLQKRNQRIISTDPYQKETAPGKEAPEGKSANGGEPAASWLAL